MNTKERDKRVQALREFREHTLRYCNQDKFVYVYPRPLAAMIDAVLEELDELRELKESASDSKPPEPPILTGMEGCDFH